MTEREKQLTELVERQAKTIDRLEKKVTLLEQKVDYLVGKIYGSSSEKLHPNQLHLAFEEEFAKKQEAASDEPSDVELTLVAKPKRSPRKEPRLPENLPVHETTLIPPEVLGNPELYVKIGEKVTDKLDIHPASFSLNRTIRPVYTRKGADIAKFAVAPLPASLLEKSLLSPSLLSHIICSKYCDHLPLYRQQQILARRYNLHLSRSTLCEWVEVGANWLEPIWKLIASNIRTSQHIQVEETPVNYLDQKGAKQQGYFWVYNSTQGDILYDWKSSRHHQSLHAVLTSESETFAGELQCDGYSAYQTWANKQDDVTLLGCWVHARRKFFDAKDQHPDAVKTLNFIAKLYKNEHQFNEFIAATHHPPEVIAYYRKRYSSPIAKQLHQHLKTIQNRHLPKSNLGKAISYALNQWTKLGRALSSGHHDLDNNKAENAVRPLKLGAKNWLFIGREEAGWRSAVLYTMIENIRSQGKDPYAYLKWVFEQIPSMTNQDDLRTLLPQEWIDAQTSHNAEQPVTPAIAV